MNTDILNSFISEMLDLLKTAKDFTVDQLPKVATEILHYNLFKSGFWLLVNLAALFFLFKGWKLWLDEVKKDRELEFLIAPIILCTIVLLVCFTFNIDDVSKIVLAPRVYLIEYLTKLLSKK